MIFYTFNTLDAFSHKQLSVELFEFRRWVLPGWFHTSLMKYAESTNFHETVKMKNACSCVKKKNELKLCYGCFVMGVCDLCSFLCMQIGVCRTRYGVAGVASVSFWLDDHLWGANFKSPRWWWVMSSSPSPLSELNGQAIGVTFHFYEFIFFFKDAMFVKKSCFNKTFSFDFLNFYLFFTVFLKPKREVFVCVSVHKFPNNIKTAWKCSWRKLKASYLT